MGRSSGQGVAPAGWFQDPERRHQWRYWDGTAWTDRVADDGQQSRAPLGAPPAPVADEPPESVRSRNWRRPQIQVPYRRYERRSATQASASGPRR